MKFLGLCWLAALASCWHATGATRTVDNILTKQQEIFDLFSFHSQNSYHGNSTDVDNELTNQLKEVDYTNSEVVKKFLAVTKSGLLSKTKIFSLTFNKQREEAISLFNLYWNAKTYEIFYKTALLTRKYVNYDIFVYAFTLAVFHRPDCKNVVTPQSYEANPFAFVSSDVIKKMKSIVKGDTTNMDGVISSGNKYTIHNYLSDTPDINPSDKKLAHFTDDIGLSAFYYNYNLEYPFWMAGNTLHLNDDRRGELYYYLHQQLIAHYMLERLSGDLPSIQSFSWHRFIRNGYNPKTLFRNGLTTPIRPNLYVVNNKYKILMVDDAEKYERTIRHSIQKGYITLHDKRTLALRNAEDIETLGRFIQGDKESRDVGRADYGAIVAKYLLGGSATVTNKEDYVPSAIEQLQTTTRDPMFYQLWERYLQYFYHFKGNLPPYTANDLSFTGITVEKVTLTKLTTFFEDYDFDITNCIENTYDTDNKKEMKTFYARQKRLNHEPFSVTINVTSDKNIDATVRVFLGPKYDNVGRAINLIDSWKHFVELDNFMYTLKIGKNAIVRKDTEFIRTAGDPTVTRDLYKMIKKSATKPGASADKTRNKNSWPLRLVLPKGKDDGCTFQVFVVITMFKSKDPNYGTEFPWQYTGTLAKGGMSEDFAYGFPLDRPAYDDKFTTTNMKFADVKIFHTQKITSNDVVSQFKDDKELLKANINQSDAFNNRYKGKNIIDDNFDDEYGW